MTLDRTNYILNLIRKNREWAGAVHKRYIVLKENRTNRIMGKGHYNKTTVATTGDGCNVDRVGVDLSTLLSN